MQRLHRTPAVVIAACASLSLAPAAVAGTPHPDDAPVVAAAYAQAVTHICSKAVLFEGRHEMGTRAGALSVARDIRASTRRRLARVGAVHAPIGSTGLARRWITLEQRLANAYADNWVRIFDVIESADTPAERAREPQAIERLVHAPDTVKRAAARLANVLHVPDCTGGERRPAAG
jgi:hypothetical protein